MAQDTLQLFGLLCLLQIKHMFADFFMQTPKMLQGRDMYAHMGRAQHAGIHAAGSAIAFFLVGSSVVFVLVTIVLEWIVHFHIDWAKARYSKMKQQTPAQAGFWQAVGADQAAHQLTYVAMAAAWVAVYFPSAT